MYGAVAGGIVLILVAIGVGWRVTKSKSVRTQGITLGDGQAAWNTVANPTYDVHQAVAGGGGGGGGGRVVNNAVYDASPGQANQQMYAEIPGANTLPAPLGHGHYSEIPNNNPADALATGHYVEIPALAAAPLSVSADNYDTLAIRVGSSNDMAASAQHYDHDWDEFSDDDEEI